MTREEAINEIKSWDFLEGKEIEAIHTLIPELRESEDERIRKEIIDFIQWAEDRGMTRHDYHQAKRPAAWIAYLEKQKECVVDNNKTSAEEDERIRARLIEYFQGFLEGYEDCYKDGGCVKWEGLDVKSILAWLEKQKENANSFTDGVIEVRSFQRGLEEGRRLEGQKEQKHPNGCFTCDEYKKGYEEGRRNGFTAGYNKAMKEVEQKEQKPNIELIQKSWYMEGYHDKEFNCEPKWIIKTGEGGPRYEENPKYGQIIEQKPVEYLSKDKVYTIMSKLTKLSTSNLIPFNSPEYKKINEITSDVRSLLDYPIEQKPNIEICPHSIKSKSYLETDYPIEQKPVVTHGETYHVDTLGTQQVIAGKMPQKPAEWDDYTKTNLGRAIQIIKDARGTLHGYQTDDGIYECDKAIEALEHFLYRGLEIEKSAEWSEEDEENFKWFDKFFRAESVVSGGKDIPQDKYLWFKSRRPQPKQEWSEEDEEMLNSCICSIEESKENRYAYKETDGDTSYDHEIAWLKSLRPQPHWKPSEEQEEPEYYQHFDPDC